MTDGRDEENRGPLEKITVLFQARLALPGPDSISTYSSTFGLGCTRHHSELFQLVGYGDHACSNLLCHMDTSARKPFITRMDHSKKPLKITVKTLTL
jgi:hypothetical protein